MLPVQKKKKRTVVVKAEVAVAKMDKIIDGGVVAIINCRWQQWWQLVVSDGIVINNGGGSCDDKGG